MNALAAYTDKTKPCETCAGTGFQFDSAELSKVVREFLDATGRTQNGLAEELEISWGYFSELINGKKPWNGKLVEKLHQIIKS